MGSGCPAERSCRLENDLVRLAGCVFNGCQNIFTLQEGIILRNFPKRRPGAQQLRDIRHAHSFAANAGPTTAFAVFHRDPFEQSCVHADILAGNATLFMRDGAADLAARLSQAYDFIWRGAWSV